MQTWREPSIWRDSPTFQDWPLIAFSFVLNMVFISLTGINKQYFARVVKKLFLLRRAKLISEWTKSKAMSGRHGQF